MRISAILNKSFDFGPFNKLSKTDFDKKVIEEFCGNVIIISII